MEEAIGERVRRLRKAKGWTQVALAYNADRAPSVVSQVETGKRDPELATIKKLAVALEVDWRYLLLGDQLPKAPAPTYSGLRSGGEDGRSGGELVPLDVGLQRMKGAGGAAQLAARDWRRELSRSLEEGKPLTRLRILEMYSFHNELSRLYVGSLEALLEGARQGVAGIIDKGVSKHLSPDPSQWPYELKEPLYEAGARIAALPKLIKKIELEASEECKEAAEQALYEEFNVEDHLPAEVLREPEWSEELNKALAEVGA
jgi:transcriptional regulator with XRE-family HTH domain